MLRRFPPAELLLRRLPQAWLVEGEVHRGVSWTKEGEALRTHSSCLSCSEGHAATRLREVAAACERGIELVKIGEL